LSPGIGTSLRLGCGLGVTGARGGLVGDCSGLPGVDGLLGDDGPAEIDREAEGAGLAVGLPAELLPLQPATANATTVPEITAMVGS
jgi:hypothetical protein